jgi:polyhydroxybutyrate depolymerase
MKKLYLILLIVSGTIHLAAQQQYFMQHDGQTRSYWLHLPQGYSAGNLYPLVLSLHGVTSNGFQQMYLTGFNGVSDQGGFIVAYPDGIDNTWNISSSSGVDDVGYISALIDTLNAAYGVNLEMVYACGMSMGGFMSYRLGCELSHRLAAIASVTGLQAFYPCQPSKPMPVMQIHGTADPTVPYAGVEPTVSFWTAFNGCPEEPIQTEFPDIDQTDNSTVTSSYYCPCSNSTEVILYTVINGEHSWPGSNFILGVTNQDIDASTEIWNFFRKFNLQGSTGITDLPANAFEFSLGPNPAEDHVWIRVEEKIGQYDLAIYSLTGSLLLNLSDIGPGDFKVDCSSLPQGMYFIEIQSSGTKVARKFTVR